MAGKVHCVDIVHLDFDSLARYRNEELYRYMQFTRGLTKRSLIPKRIRWNAYRVSRSDTAVRIHLLLATDESTDPKEVARFGFVRGPQFSEST